MSATRRALADALATCEGQLNKQVETVKNLAAAARGIGPESSEFRKGMRQGYLVAIAGLLGSTASEVDHAIKEGQL